VDVRDAATALTQTQAVSPLPPGAESCLAGRYAILRELGRGGMGVVYRAEDTELGRHVALKFLPQDVAEDQNTLDRFMREARTAAALNHPNICTIYEIGRHEGTPFLIMELLEGHTLKTTISGRPMDVDEMLRIGSEVAGALAAAHAKGIVHRDIKPEHILLNRGPYGELDLHLLDFGVCAADTAPADERGRERGRVYGTPSYASPEQASGNPFVDARADLFSVGVTMFEALTGKLPFTGPDVTAVLRRIIREDAPRLGLFAPQHGPDMEGLVAKLMSRNPSGRHPSARALMRALDPWLIHRVRTERLLAATLEVAPETTSIRPTARHEVVAA